MTAKSIQAWVIHKQCSGNTSSRVYFFTKELGLIACLCRGGQTAQKQSLLQAFTPLWISVEERYNRYYAQSIECNALMVPLIGTSLFSGLYLNELLYRALSFGYADEALFNAYVMTLNGLSQSQNMHVIETFLRRFEWVLLNASGHSFSLTNEARTGDEISAQSFYQFIAGEGFIKANSGIPGAHVQALAEDNLTQIDYLKSAKMIMRRAIDNLLGGRELKARSLFI